MELHDEYTDVVPWLREAQDLHRAGSPLDMTAEPPLYRASAFIDRHLHVGLPWCGIFVAHCLQKTMPGISLPRRHMRARPWSTWGQATTPRSGAVMVFWHCFRRSPFGHVGFYCGEDADGIHVLSGNQHDRITITNYPRNRIIACRWPSEAS